MERERDQYYGCFGENNHAKNGGSVFYNLDEKWEQEHTQTKYRYSNSTELYEYYEMLGEGSFSKVFRAKFLPTSEIIAVKVSLHN